MDKAPDAFRTISEVADELDVPQHVLRFWETRFGQIKPMKRGGGRRYYRPDDVDLLRGIRHLLYGEGYTIRGVQRILKDDGIKSVQAVWKDGAPPLSAPRADDQDDSHDDATHDDADAAAHAASRSDDEPDDVAFEGDESADARVEPTLSAVPTPSSPGARPAPAREMGQREARQFSRENFQPVKPQGPAGTPAAAAPQTAPQTAPLGSLDRDALRKLQATLYELGESRRILEIALKDDA